MKRKLTLLFLCILTPLIIYGVVQTIALDSSIRHKFATQSFAKPVQFYSRSLSLQKEQLINTTELEALLKGHQYRKRAWGSFLRPSDYTLATGESCQSILQGLHNCFAFHHHIEQRVYIIGIDEQDKIVSITSTEPTSGKSQEVASIIMFPKVFAQYLGSYPVLQEPVKLSQIPRHCLDAALAIEDPDFLQHKGISWRGIMRAVWVNLKKLRFSQGGSTITQQLVKNYFLSPERTVKRKLTEMLIATLVEWHIPKDDILKTYLNVIYWGQQGNYQVRGAQAASRYYFQKPIEQLDLPECALIAAVINSPGLFNPFRAPERALKRRARVLTKMLEQGRILQSDFDLASAAPLPTRKSIEIRETAPYFIDAVKDQLQGMGFNDLAGYRIYTSLDLSAQASAQKAVQGHLNRLEETSAYHKKNIKHSLQSILLASDTDTGDVVALIGGRNHRRTRFNRALNSRRQVGSIFKPFVYLTALLDNPDFSPLTLIDNSPLIHTYDRQKWKPQNYDKTVSGPVPAFFALKESMNIPTARLALETGLDNIIATAKTLGIHSELKPLPSLSLGAFELAPLEVLQAYQNLARLGNTKPLRLVLEIKNNDDETVWRNQTQAEQKLLAEKVGVLIGMLRETMRTGTAASSRKRGFIYDSAGKTGTTSGYKDAWFAGFTPKHVAIVWTGYDDNTPVKLSGASGALPIWLNYMKSMSTAFPNSDFPWLRENLKMQTLTVKEMVDLGVPPIKAVETRLFLEN